MSFNGKIIPKELTSELLNSTVNKATRNLIDGDWNEKNATLYCGITGINVAGCEELITRTNNIKALTIFYSGNVIGNDIEDEHNVLNNSQINKSKYNQ